MSRIIIRYDEQGDVTFHIEDCGNVRVFVVDERAPDDRVYEFNTRDTTQEIDDLLGDDKVGSRFDGSWAAKKLGQVGVN